MRTAIIIAGSAWVVMAMAVTTLPARAQNADAERVELQQQLNRVEPRGGRDPRGGFYGRDTVWSGDYKDALDRRQGALYDRGERGGRDPSTGDFYGRDTVWPGDYNDAVDRGEFPAGGPSVIPRRTFNRY